MPKPTFGSLFAGIGGFDLGFERAGFRCKWQVEIDDYATKVLEKHWPKVHRERDIRQCGSINLERVDCIIGGFPCQDISYAGRGAGLAGERSGLFFEAVRLVRELQPRAVVLENVAALLTRGLDRVLGTLAEIGYDAQWHCIPAAAVGAPHIRDRVFVIAYARRKLRKSRAVGESSCEASPHGDAEAKDDQRRGEDVADANCTRLKDACGSEAITERHRQRAVSRSSWWDAEPAVGRSLDGFSSWLDASGLILQSHKSIMAHGLAHSNQEDSDGKSTEDRPDKILQALWDRIYSQENKREAGGSVGISSQDVLLAYVCKLKESCEKRNVSLASSQAKEGLLRSVRPYEELASSPHRSKRSKQPAGKHTDTLQALSRLLAHDSQSAWVAYRRSDACPKVGWEDGIARVANGIPKRVDRLRCLGNAIVPQVAEVVARMTKQQLDW